jgi:hypothetical protein
MKETDFRCEVETFLKWKSDRDKDNIYTVVDDKTIFASDFYHPPDTDKNRKPCDIVGGFFDLRGKIYVPFSLELKLIKDRERFQFCHIEQSQHDHLLKVSYLYPRPEWACLLLNFRRAYPRLNCTFRVPYLFIYHQIKEGAKGIDLEELMDESSKPNREWKHGTRKGTSLIKEVEKIKIRVGNGKKTGWKLW